MISCEENMPWSYFLMCFRGTLFFLIYAYEYRRLASLNPPPCTTHTTLQPLHYLSHHCAQYCSQSLCSFSARISADTPQACDHIRLVDHATLSVRLNFCNGYANSSYVYLSVIRKIDCILLVFVYFPAMQFSSSRLYSYSRSAVTKQSYLRALHMQSSAYRHALVANCFH